MASNSDDGSHWKQKPLACRDQNDGEEGADGKDINGNGILLEKLSLGGLDGRKKLLVLDLAGILCVRVFHTDKANIPDNRTPDAANGSFFDDCTNSGFGTKENKNKPIFFKELKKLWENKSSNLPWIKGTFLSSNTLLIDDKPYKALLNPPHTAIFPTEYMPDQIDDATLGPNGDLRAYLDGLAKAADVPAYVKEHPFGQAAISTNHPDWDFYSAIIVHSKGKESSASGEFTVLCFATFNDPFMSDRRDEHRIVDVSPCKGYQVFFMGHGLLCLRPIVSRGDYILGMLSGRVGVFAHKLTFQSTNSS
ncbi:unnamed protein product [Dovyalis caffra]|uniref:Mitochondrial import inner membrane translocase subunit TIM50 n=1 Tax=Dovyalis caffra TaxID=77055 RepID=A0AAV1QTS5_9ROSI|nr:unnamed protein product [Dovyalis caffra]